MFAETKIDGWESVQKFFSALSNKRSGWIFRGHADADWLLNSSLQRTAADYRILPRVLQAVERNMLKMFKRRAHHYLPQPPKESDDIEWLSILQHHGGITRLLDCTHSFYVALYFALESSLTDACVWCMSGRGLTSRAIELLNGLKEVHGINVQNDIILQEGRETAQAFFGTDVHHNIVIPVKPHRLNERMAIQQGIFLFPTNLAATFQDNLLSMFDLQGIEPLMNDINEDEIIDGIKVIIPKCYHKEILTDLYKMNITAASLFPGLDGYARSLKYIIYSTPDISAFDKKSQTLEEERILATFHNISR